MRAMVLAAGLGTRLRPLTSDRPKALVKVAGRTLLEITLARLRSFGVTDVIINAHHLADQIIEYLRANHNFELRIEISREELLLDTGGGLKQAAWFFKDDPQPFIVHNVDVMSTIDLRRMAEFHRERKALATLAVKQRNTTRYLLFDDQLQLCGRRVGASTPEMVRPAEQVNALAFCGIHVISPRIFAKMPAERVFSIITAYLELAAEGESVVAFRADEYAWQDLGTPEHIVQAEQDFKAKLG